MMDASEYHAAIRRLHEFRALYERLDAAEDALANSSTWDYQQRETKLRDLRRKLVRAAPEIHADLARPRSGAEMVTLRDAPALGGRISVVRLVDAIVNGYTRAYHLNPTILDPMIESVIAWHERRLAQVEEAEDTDRRRAAERETRRAERAELNSQRRWIAVVLVPVRVVLSVWSDLVSVGSWIVRYLPL